MTNFDVDESDTDEEKIDKDFKLLSPTSSWSVMVDIRAIARLSKKSCSCGHNLQLLNFRKTRITFTCITCHGDEIFNLCSQSDDIMEEDINVDVSLEQEGGKDGNDSKIEATNKEKKIDDDVNLSDEEIDKLLMDSPVKERSVDTSDENAVPVNLLYPEVNMKEDTEKSKPTSSQSRPLTPGLRLKPFKELQPLVPGLPQYTSRRMEDGVNPMENIPHYEEDDSLVEESINVVPSVSFNSIPTQMAQSPSGPAASYKVIKVGNIDKARLASSMSGAGGQHQPQMFPSQYHPQLQQRQTPSPTSLGNPRPQMRTMTTTPPTSRVRVRMTSPYRPAATGTATAPQRPRPPSSRSPAPLPYSLPASTHVMYNQGGQPPLVRPATQVLGFPANTDHQNIYNLNRINNQVNMRTPGVLISQFSKPELPLYHDPRLPPGWGRTIQKAPNGSCFVVIHSPEGRVFKSKEELSRRLPMDLVL